uniref:Septin n=1 Tax=Rhabditophanes sp. KR3021 TaxID=114890 RepID=A0AC35TMB9_9BILA
MNSLLNKIMKSRTSFAEPRSIHTACEQDYVGIATYTNQIFRRCVKKGFEFNLMVVGETSLGKSTFLNTLLDVDLKEYEGMTSKCDGRITERSYYVIENEVKVKIRLIETPGYGDGLNNTFCYKPIVDYIDSQFWEYLEEQNKITRKAVIPDTRVHLCLFFIAPTGQNMKELDVKMMKKLDTKVNLVPVIAKADTLTYQELAFFKTQVLKQIEDNKIEIYKFESHGDGHPDSIYPYIRVPYGVVCSNHVVVSKDGRRCRVRKYPWGVVEVDNIQHNDFAALRDIVIRKHLVDLIEDTHNVHFENYRFARISDGFKGPVLRFDPAHEVENEMALKDADTEVRMHQMVQAFADTIKKREKKLEDKQKGFDLDLGQLQTKLEDKLGELKQLMSEKSEVGSIRFATNSLESVNSTSFMS